MAVPGRRRAAWPSPTGRRRCALPSALPPPADTHGLDETLAASSPLDGPPHAALLTDSFFARHSPLASAVSLSLSPRGAAHHLGPCVGRAWWPHPVQVALDGAAIGEDQSQVAAGLGVHLLNAGSGSRVSGTFASALLADRTCYCLLQYSWSTEFSAPSDAYPFRKNQ